MPNSFRRLESIPRRQAAPFGGKARALSRLARAGFPVPTGYAISSVACDSFVESILAPEEQVSELMLGAPDPEQLEGIRARIRAASLPDELTVQISQAADELLAAGVESCAVRSSSTREDLATTSAAGLHATALEVRGALAIEAAVLECWASLFTPAALTYLARHPRGDEGPPSMGVVVQAMVASDKAGVLFTGNPLTGDGSEVVINASYGLGTSVADGRVSPDTFRIDKATRGPRDRVIGDKHERTVLRTVGGTRRLVTEPTPEALRAQPCLDDEAVGALLDVALRLEQHFEGPQDVEWALCEGKLYVLQSRPITTPLDIHTWRKHETTNTRRRDSIVWSNVNVGEALPGVATPLTWSILSAFSELGFRRAFGSLGCTVPKDAELVGEFRGRIYLNLTEFMEITSQVPGLRPKRLLALGGGGEGDRLESDLRPRSKRGFLARLPVTAARFAKENFGLNERVAGFEKLFASERARIEGVDMAVLSPSGLAAMFRDIEHLLDESGAVMLTVYGNLLSSVVLFQGVLAAVAKEPGEAERLQRDLLGGLTDVESAAPGIALFHIAQDARHEPEVVERLRDGDPAALRLDDLGDGRTRRALARFMTAYGHRGTREAEISEPRWREDPTLILATLAAHLRAERPTTPRELSERQRARREAALETLRKRLPRPLAATVRRLLLTVQRFTRLRERLRSHVTAVLGMFRIAALDASRRIEVDEPGAGPDAAFYLTLDEVYTRLRGGREPLGLRIQRRRRRVARDRALPDPPDTFVGYPPPVQLPTGDEDSLVGLSACSGVVEGVVRVVHAPADAAQFQPGEILVAGSADVGWSPLFLVAAGVVTDLGGPLSHAAIVLREYGVPSVVNVKIATRVLQTGDRVRLDGASGTVEVIARRPA